MFERFTQRARQVIVLSQEEARGLNHNYIGTEHILLGMLAAPESIGGTVLTEYGLTREQARAEVENRVGRGKGSMSGHIPFTPRAKKTLELSLREALTLGHNYIGTEHILLGLIREGDGVAVQILSSHGDLAKLRAAVIAAIPASQAGRDEGDEGTEETNAVLRWLRNRLTRHGTASVPLRFDVTETDPTTRGTPAAEAALRKAATLAGPAPVGSHHLLLAALADPDSAASATLAELGVDLDELKEKLRTAPLTGTSDEQPELAGRRQMALEVSDEVLTLVFTDPVIVAAGRDALRAVQGGTRGGDEPSPAGQPAPAAGQPERPGTESAAANVIRGDHPAAENLAAVWLELRKTLATVAGGDAPAARRRQVKVARRLMYGGDTETARASAPDEPGAGPGDAARPGPA